MAGKHIDLGRFGVAGTDRIRPSIKKGGTYWSGIDSVTITFEKPDRNTRFSRSMVLDDDSLGRWYYDVTSADIPDEQDSEGWWTVGFRVVDGNINKQYPYSIGFFVSREP